MALKKNTTLSNVSNLKRERNWNETQKQRPGDLSNHNVKQSSIDCLYTLTCQLIRNTELKLLQSNTSDLQ